MADELVVGTVVAAEPQPGARAPALLLTLDLGSYGQEQAVLPSADRVREVCHELLEY